MLGQDLRKSQNLVSNLFTGSFQKGLCNILASAANHRHILHFVIGMYLHNTQNEDEALFHNMPSSAGRAAGK
jgi:hypothetical protein